MQEKHALFRKECLPLCRIGEASDCPIASLKGNPVKIRNSTRYCNPLS